VFARVHHQNVNGAEGSDVATIQIDITVTPPTCTDADQDGYYLEGQTCGTEADCDDTDAEINPGATEVCNGVDDDCDGEVDEGVKLTFYQDFDNDTYGNAAETIQACFPPEGYVEDDTDCNDSDPTIHPGATEVCGDGIDQDCDGSDLPCPGPNCTDNDGDGYAIEGDQCGDIDCNDSDPTIHPGATEVCGDGIDQDCDGYDTVCPEVTINAYKIVCESEADLPNWGDGGPDITETSAQDFVNGNQNCYLEEDWSFEWAYAGTANPGDNIIGPAGGAWTTFGPTDSSGLAVTSISSLSGDRIWVREVMQEGYIAFSGDTTAPRDDVSAELYCHQDVLNYDNYDYILNPQWDNTYYCVGFNVLIEEPIEGCTDPEATNYNPEATVDDGSCEYDVYGCTDPEANNYNPEATVDDGSCEYPPGPVYGCTDPTATNYNSAATVDDGSCTYGGGSRSGGYAGPAGEVLGEEIVEPCGIYLYEYIQYGADNNPEEVKKLQVFLNDYMGSNLPITGIYDLATMQVVNQFQVQCKEEILRPWVEDGGTMCDENEPTGYVYKTTQRWINLIMCPTLNLPMPDLSGYYPKADCLAYWGETPAVLGEEVVTDGEPSEEPPLIEEPETEGPEEVPEDSWEAEALGAEVVEDTERGGLTWEIWIIVIVLAVIIILVLYFLLRKPKQQP